MATVQTRVQIVNSLGLHLRPASQLVKVANEFEQCEIKLVKDDQAVNAKSIMGVIMLAAEQGSELIIEAEGDTAEDALNALSKLFEDGFGEQ